LDLLAFGRTLIQSVVALGTALQMSFQQPPSSQAKRGR
jgi:hypothetical protein